MASYSEFLTPHGTTLSLTFAVHRHTAFWALANVQEAPHDEVAGRGAIHKEQVVVLETRVAEAAALIDLPVEPHHVGHMVLPEVWEVRLRGMERVACVE